MSGPRERFDVMVAGGGSAGLAAAATAARLGARTLLAERSDRLGGNATLAMVHTICGLYHAAGAGGPEPAHTGFPLRFARALARAGGAGAPERAGRVFYLPIRPAVFGELAARIVASLPAIECRLRATLVAASLSESPAADSAVALSTPEGPREVSARVVVDTTGDATAGALAGAECWRAEPGELQHPSYVFQLSDVDTTALEGFSRLRLSLAVAGAARAGTLPPGCESVVVRPSGAPGELFATLNLPKPSGSVYDPLDPACVRELARDARERAEAVAAFLRAQHPAFSRSRVSAWPQQVGIRETRRLAGLEVLRGEDVRAGRRTPDEVALSTWPIELWHDHRRARLEYGAGPCGIPLGALLSRSRPELAAAGRCLSATHEGLGAARVIATAMATGEAAGAAAALAVDGGRALRAVSAAEVRDRVARLAAELPAEDA
jgi:hypothetical protein